MKISPRTCVLIARANKSGLKAGYVEQGVKLTPPPPTAKDIFLELLALANAGKGPVN